MKNLRNYKIGISISLLSMVFGIIREFLIVGLLGFTGQNDTLQLYLSIFYTMSLSNDAVRLACLNLYTILPLRKILISASIIAGSFSILLGCIMSYTTGGLNPWLFIITLVGCYFNLISVLLTTYKQRNDLFLRAQWIYVMPNFILIPGILFSYLVFPTHLITLLVCLTSIIPIIQCAILLSLNGKKEVVTNNLSFTASLILFLRHFLAVFGEQLFQIILRAAFYRNGPGFLSLFALAIRVYAVIRFILIDSFIGVKLATWDKEITDVQGKKSYNLLIAMLAFVGLGFFLSLDAGENLMNTAIKMVVLLVFGFVLSTLVRITYFKINRQENNPQLVIRFALFELTTACIAFIIAMEFNYPILEILWLGYVAKPFAQLILLRSKRDLEPLTNKL